MEMSWATLLKLYGFSQLWSTVAMVTIFVSVLYFLSLAIKTLPLGTTYAVFAGMASLGTAVIGIVFFREPTSLLRLSLLALIMGGIVGLRLLEAKA